MNARHKTIGIGWMSLIAFFLFIGPGCSSKEVHYKLFSESLGQGEENGETSVAGQHQVNRSNPNNKEIAQLGMGVINQPGGTMGHQSHQGSDQLSPDTEGGTAQHDGLRYFHSGNIGPEQNDYFGQHSRGDTGSGFSYGPVTGFSHGTIPLVTPGPQKLATPSFGHDTAPESGGSSAESMAAIDRNPGGGASYGHEYPDIEPGSTSHLPNLAGHSNYPNNGNLLPEEINQEVVIAKAEPSFSHGYPSNQRQSHLSPSLAGYPDGQEDSMYQGNQSMASATGIVNDVYFDFDSWRITREAGQALETDAAWFKSNKVQSVTIEGHCDQRGTRSYNMVLGKKRAQATREYLVNLGANPENIKIISFGNERPFCHEG